jgi:hypothetical protein
LGVSSPDWPRYKKRGLFLLGIRSMLKPGDRVKLKLAHARTIRSSGRLVDWPNRRGVIRSIAKRGEIHIKWDDRKTIDPWPASVVERSE